MIRRPPRLVRRAFCPALAILLAGCKASTSRPSFVPYPEAQHGELGLGQPNRDSSVVRVTRVVVAALEADSIPVARVHDFDGFVDSGWFDAQTLKPTNRRPLGPDVVRVRAWVDPGKPGFSKVELETVYIPLADPSRPARELEAPAPADHPITKRVENVMRALVKQYGEPEEETVRPTTAPAPLPADSAERPGRDTSAVAPKRDTSAIRPMPDTTKVVPKRDTSGAA